MEVLVVRGDVYYTCKSEEQLKLFLEAGYIRVESKAEPKKKKAKKE